jgi:Cu(I)/Ag(I) efflux system periplasmic protein CusF
MKAFTTLALALALFAGAAYGESKVHKAEGTITKVDRARATVTIKHGPVASINWPTMTMAFGVKDKALLDKAKPGTVVSFAFVQSGRDYLITDIR